MGKSEQSRGSRDTGSDRSRSAGVSALARPETPSANELTAFRSDDLSRAEILEQRAAVLAQPATLANLTGTDGQHIVCFRAGDSSYGVELRQLREIRPVERIATVPNTPRFLQGLMQVHGEITPVIDLVEFFGFRRAEALPSPTVVLVVARESDLLGIACDDLRDVRPLTADDVVSVPAAVNATEREIARGVTKDRTLILDGDALLTHPRLSVGHG